MGQIREAIDALFNERLDITRCEAIKIIQKAAPEAIAWIQEASEYLYEYRPILQEKADMWKGRTRQEYQADIDRLDALIARAK